MKTNTRVASLRLELINFEENEFAQSYVQRIFELSNSFETVSALIIAHFTSNQGIVQYSLQTIFFFCHLVKHKWKKHMTNAWFRTWEKKKSRGFRIDGSRRNVESMNPVTCKSKDTHVKKKLLMSLEVRSNVTKVKVSYT